MHILLFMAGIVWLVWSALIFGVAKGGIHEVYGAILASSGILFLGLASLLKRLQSLGSPQSKPSDFSLGSALQNAAGEEYSPDVIRHDR